MKQAAASAKHKETRKSGVSPLYGFMFMPDTTRCNSAGTVQPRGKGVTVTVGAGDLDGGLWRREIAVGHFQE